ncbi:MAG TPA: glycosyltransferase family 87 protein, partial [Sumerlaeia bacterium]|nr:glycosyltransferase family 87 protein [Sumerlaeia bacterium]
TLLDPPDAFRTWFLLNHLFLIIALALMFWSLRLRPGLPDLAFAVLTGALCYPLHRTLTAGQLNCALLLLFALVFALERRGWFIAAGGAAAFAFLFKLTPGVLFLYFLWGAVLGRGEARAGRWRALAAMAFFSLLLMAVAVAWVGVDRHLAFRPVLAQMGYGKSTWAEYGQQYYRDAANQSFNSFFHHIAAAGGGTASWIPLGVGWANGLTRLAFLICVGLVVWRLLSDRTAVQSPSAGADAQGDADSAPYALFILLSLLAPSIYWDHYAIIALWPLFACWSRLPREARPAALVLEVALALLLGSFLEVDVWLAMLFLIAALCALGHLCVRRRSWGWPPLFWALAAAMLLARFPFDFPAFRHGVGLLAMSLKLWGTLALFGLCLRMVGERTGNGRPDATIPLAS